MTRRNTQPRLMRPQIRTMLYLFGVPFSRQPSKVTEERQLLNHYRLEQPERFQQLYNLVTKGDKPDVADPTPTATTIKYDLQQEVENMRDQVLRDTATSLVDLLNSVEKTKEWLQSDAERIAKAALDKAASSYQRIEVKAGGRVRKMDAVLPEAFELLVQLAGVRQNIMMVGPSGSGKTFLAEQLSKALGLRFGSISCSVGMSESQLLGYMLPTGAGGKFEYHASDFVTCYEKGGVFLLDEMDAADENTLIIINRALANESFSVPQRVGKTEVKKHKDFVCVAAMNTLGTGEDMTYTGRNALDGATLDRFRAGFVFIDYDTKVEQSLINPEVLAWGLEIRAIIQQNKLERIMSTRVMKDLTTLTEANKWTVKEWNRTYFADWSQSERNKVEHILARG